MTEEKPARIQRRRIKGWKMPENTVYVGRPTRWGNPFFSGEYKSIADVLHYREYLAERTMPGGILELKELRGKNLACWCRLDQICHADVLLELSNAE